MGNSLAAERADAVEGCISRWVDDVGEPGMKKANGQAAGAGELKQKSWDSWARGRDKEIKRSDALAKKLDERSGRLSRWMRRVTKISG